ncbi:unnamed protein product [Candidula unifasciata]|uniref:SMP-LTD domain-containing protein n=1 Tax=Candidula unifasciata TaxID=100452 RepID=A0A8S3ZJY0_9EUPU|nr:unnamed protein product [Candidula unifasciata]
MNLQKDDKEALSTSDSKQGARTDLSGFSFKQLEENNDDDDNLFRNKDKQETIIVKTNSGHNSSASSMSAVSGAQEDRSSLKTTTGKVVENSKLSKKPDSLSNETSSLAIITATIAKLETSKDLFSSFKGRITDRISRKIEEFSGDSSSNSSQEKEKAKLFTLHKTSSQKSVEKESASVPYTELVSSTPEKEISAFCDLKDKSPQQSEPLMKEISPSSVKEVPSFLFSKRRNLSSPQKDTFSNPVTCDLVSTQPLTTSNTEDNFENVIEPHEAELQLKRKQGANQDVCELDSSRIDEPDAETHVPAKHFSIEPTEDFSSFSVLCTSEQTKASPKIKHLNKSETRAHSFTSFSDKTDPADKQFVFPLGQDSSKTLPEGENEKQIKEPKFIDKIADEDKAVPVIKSATNTSSTISEVFTVAVVLFAYVIVPLPSYISGFIMGTLLASFCWRLYMWLTEKPQMPKPVLLPHVDEPPPVPEMKINSEGEEFLYKGWMNELTNYRADDYHLNKTHSIFVSLEGSHLRLQRPKNVIPKRAMWDEVLPNPQFIHQRHFHLPGAKVFLLPHGLVRKRIWSKKYPICIALTNKSLNEDGKLKHISSEPILKEKSSLPGMDFEFVTEEKCDHNLLYLFARTCREKEEWYQRLSSAAAGKPLGNHVKELKRVLSQNSPSLKQNTESVRRHKREGSTDSTSSTSSKLSLEGEAQDLLTFAHYMGRLMPSGSLSGSSSPSHATKDKNSDAAEVNKNAHNKDGEEGRVLNPGSPVFCDSQLFWVNALIGRCFFDFLRDKWWIGKVREKLQKKLSKIHVPHFIEELQVTDINMGSEVPGIRHASRPYIDDRGFWVNLDLTYAGGFQMTIETKVNLMKLKKSSSTSSQSEHSIDRVKSPALNSDEEDSAESSTDEEEEAPSNSDDSASGGGASKKFIHYLSKFAQSKYFQQATEYKVVKRAMENVSNTPLTLSVTVVSLVGRLALNIPPPPSDRLWYGFLGNPHLRLSAKPQVGERAITITHIIEWIEKKLATEFQRVFVMPNMDDLIIPILVPPDTSGTTVPRSASL